MSFPQSHIICCGRLQMEPSWGDCHYSTCYFWFAAYFFSLPSFLLGLSYHYTIIWDFDSCSIVCTCVSACLCVHVWVYMCFVCSLVIAYLHNCQSFMSWVGISIQRGDSQEPWHSDCWVWILNVPFPIYITPVNFELLKDSPSSKGISTE